MNRQDHLNYIRKILTFNQLPQSLQNSLLSDHDFQKKYGDIIGTLFEFEKSDLKIERKQLYDAISQALKKPSSNHFISDESGERWAINVKNQKNGTIYLIKDKKSINIGENWPLLPSKKARLTALRSRAMQVNLPQESLRKWEKDLSSEKMGYTQVDELLADIGDTPIAVMESINSQFRATSTVGSLVPNSLRYFCRLTGKSQNDDNLSSHVSNVINSHIDQLISWNTKKGLELALLLSSDREIISAIDLDKIGKDNTLQIFEKISKSGDEFSKVGAIELGITKIKQWPELENCIAKMLLDIIELSPDDPKSSVYLLSSLIILVDGQLSLLKLFEKTSPFIRRINSIAQACLIMRCLNKNISYDSFSSWAFTSRGKQFYVQNLCDLRLEPNWLPDFIFSNQLKSELIGRIAILTKQNIETIQNFSSLSEILLNQESGDIKKEFNSLTNFYPGPIQGNIESELNPEKQNGLKRKLTEGELKLESINYLVNSFFLYGVNSELIDIVNRKIRESHHHLHLNSHEDLFPMVSMLAILAAISRSTELSDDLRICIRRCTNKGKFNLKAEQLFRIVMVASASHTDFQSWAEFLGEWLTELSFKDMNKEDAAEFHSYIICLCQLVPEMWVELGRAEAALSAYVS